MTAGDNKITGLSRRGLLMGVGAAFLAGAAGGVLATRYWSERNHDLSPSFTGRSRELTDAPYAMPGPFPGRVVEVRNEHAVSSDYQINDDAVGPMVDAGMMELTGADGPLDAWRRFFSRDDVVGIKVNPVGLARGPRESGSGKQEVGCISSPAVLLSVVNALKAVGIPARNIILFERYSSEFRKAGYESMLTNRPMDGVRWYSAGISYTDTQVAIDGHDNQRHRDPNVIGYDPDVFFTAGYCHPNHNRRDERRFRSHMSAVVTRLVNKIITIPCLKDHRSAGVTLALKNMSHGMHNNVARSHLNQSQRGNGVTTGPNQCNTFIPSAVAQPALREKATLHILDGLIGVYEGGPGSWNRSWRVWPRKSLFFATDPVAMDHVGWDIIDEKRAIEGWKPVAEMGILGNAPMRSFSPRLAVLAIGGTFGNASAALLEQQRRLAEGNQEAFDRRQPEHIVLAGTMGLGVFNAASIDHRVRWLS